jgi:hypothetical protein
MVKDRNEADERGSAKVYSSITPKELEILGPLVRELALIAARRLAGEDVTTLRAGTKVVVVASGEPFPG